MKLTGSAPLAHPEQLTQMLSNDEPTTTLAPAPPLGIHDIAAHSFAWSAIALLASTVSGVISARSLGADGRGALAAATTGPVIAVWIFSMGASQAISYYASLRPKAASGLLTSWLLIAFPLSVAAIALIEIALPFLLAHQSSATLNMARLYCPPMVLIGVYSEVVWGSMLGRADFRYFNLAHGAPNLVVAASYAALWWTSHMTVISALVAFGTAYGTIAILSAIRTIRRTGLSSPTRSLARQSVIFGAKAHGMNVSWMVSARLDLLLLPAYVAASNVGLYAVVTNVSWVLVAVTSSLSSVTLPAAAVADGSAALQVLRALRLTILVAGAGGLVMAVGAGLLLRTAYGHSFESAALVLRLLLPGSILMACTGVLNAGLCAVNRPFHAAISQVPGIVITLACLPVFLPRGGIVAAGIVSSTAYAASFVAALVLFRRCADFSIFGILPNREDVRVLTVPAARSCRRLLGLLRVRDQV